MSRLAELGILTCEESADQTIWKIDWSPRGLLPIEVALSFTLVPPRLPLRGLLYSLGLHLCVIITAGYFHWWPFVQHNAPQIPEEQATVVEYQPLIFRGLPSLTAPSSASASSKSGAGKQATKLAQNRGTGAHEPLEQSLSKSVVTYAGPQEIISNLPHATNRVQTIRRPDLVAPP